MTVASSNGSGNFKAEATYNIGSSGSGGTDALTNVSQSPDEGRKWAAGAQLNPEDIRAFLTGLTGAFEDTLKNIEPDPDGAGPNKASGAEQSDANRATEGNITERDVVETLENLERALEDTSKFNEEGRSDARAIIENVRGVAGAPLDAGIAVIKSHDAPKTPLNEAMQASLMEFIDNNFTSEHNLTGLGASPEACVSLRR